MCRNVSMLFITARDSMLLISLVLVQKGGSDPWGSATKRDGGAEERATAQQTWRVGHGGGHLPWTPQQRPLHHPGLDVCQFHRLSRSESHQTGSSFLTTTTTFSVQTLYVSFSVCAATVEGVCVCCRTRVIFSLSVCAGDKGIRSCGCAGGHSRLQQ